MSPQRAPREPRRHSGVSRRSSPTGKRQVGSCGRAGYASPARRFSHPARVVVSHARSGHRPTGMERLWSRAVATGGNRWQIERPRKRLKQAKTVADRCDQLPGLQNGKEGVDGSNPSEGFGKMPANWHFDVVCTLNTRTHSGHIRGTRDALRRLTTPADTTGARSSITSIDEIPAKLTRSLV